MEIVPYDTNSKKEWDQLVIDSNSFYTIAENPRLSEVIEKSFGWRQHTFFIKKDKQTVGYGSFNQIGKKLVSLPHFSYGCLNFNNSDVKKENLTELVNQLGFDKFEYRAFRPITQEETTKITSYLPLKGNPEDQLAFFKSKLRSQIRKGGKNGLEIASGTTTKILESFYDVYSRNMKDLGSPVLSKSFFQNIIKILPENEVKIFIVNYKGKAVGASFVISYLQFSEVCWASTLRQYNKLSTNMFMYWEMIRDAVENNQKIFSFGRSTINAPTHRFKKQWLTEEKEIYFNQEKKVDSGLDIKKMTFLSTIWSKLPLGFTKSIGPIFAKKIY